MIQNGFQPLSDVFDFPVFVFDNFLLAKVLAERTGVLNDEVEVLGSGDLNQEF